MCIKITLSVCVKTFGAIKPASHSHTITHTLSLSHLYLYGGSQHGKINADNAHFRIASCIRFLWTVDKNYVWQVNYHYLWRLCAVFFSTLCCCVMCVWISKKKVTQPENYSWMRFNENEREKETERERTGPKKYSICETKNTQQIFTWERRVQKNAFVKLRSAINNMLSFRLYQ